MSELDLRHMRFGRLFVLRRARKAKDGRYKWLCACACGGVKEIAGTALKSGKTRSCGCLLIEMSTTHGMSSTLEQRCWQHMISRCRNPKDRSYPRYGGRGITVCERWLKFEHFLADMGVKPEGKTSVDRIDNDGPYAPDNCRWASNQEQCNNKGNNVVIVYGQKSMTVAQWARETGLPYEVIRMRVKRGWTASDALTKPVGWRMRRAA